MTTAAELRRFASPGIAIDDGPGGLVRVAIARGGTTGEVFLQGGTVTRWQPPGGREVLWLSAASRWSADAPIRGGIPICFPWFGPHPSRPDLPAHGFARLRPWTLVAADPLGDDGARVTLELADDAATRAWWPHHFRLRLVVEFGRRLRVALSGRVEDEDEVACGAALHTYLAVGDVRRVAVTGLGGAALIDKMRAGTRDTAPPDPLRIVAETDRIYYRREPTVRVEDPALARVLRSVHRGAGACVVWNPWIDKARKMADFGDDEWPGMLCVETANVADAAWRLGRDQRTMALELDVEPPAP